MGNKKGIFTVDDQSCENLKYNMLDVVSFKDPIALTRLVVSYLNSRHNMSTSDVFELLTKFEQSVENIFLPVTLFSSKLSPAEAIVLYLKDHRGFKFSEIAKLINRDERSLWGNYNRAKTKGDLVIEKTPYLLPLELFRDRSLSVLEHVVLYLKDNYNLNLQTISKLLNKKSTTVWSVFTRVKQKAKLAESDLE